MTDEIKAKHVFGELTLKDIRPLVDGYCDVVKVNDEEGYDLGSFLLHVFDDEGLHLFAGDSDQEPEFFFDGNSKVQVKNNMVLVSEGDPRAVLDGKKELEFLTLSQIKIDFLS
jgi:hypothetical protein